MDRRRKRFAKKSDAHGLVKSHKPSPRSGAPPNIKGNEPKIVRPGGILSIPHVCDVSDVRTSSAKTNCSVLTRHQVNREASGGTAGL